MDRRTYLAIGAATVLAGCTELGGPGEPDTSDERADDGGTEPTDDTPGDDERSEDGDDEGDPEDEEEEEHPELVGTFDDFEDLEEWWEWQDIGTLEADSSRASMGSQSALLTASVESRGQVRVRRELEEPIDVREVAPGLDLATDTDSGVVRIQLQDADAHYVEYSQRFAGGTSLTRHNFGITRIRGEPDLSKVVVLQVIRWFGDDAEGRQWVDDFHFVPRPTQGTVLLQFHGGYETHATEAQPRLEDAEFPATAFVPPARLREDEAAEGDRLTRDQVDDLAAAGWTIGAQSANGQPLDGVDPDALEDAVVDPIDWLAEADYGDDVRVFAYPGSTYTDESYELVRENYDLAFAGRSRSQGYAGNPHLCSMAETPDPGDATDLLEWTAEWGGITAIPFYELDGESALEALEETVRALEEHVEAGELEVITPAEMAEKYVYE
ncbi:polysaccharide deacetylase [Natronococcus amylolyticus DSM 10524]|uniref:Polysaccharide deacetylase n=1 Tax=Natronococcus amylolyticus DSM 10524 TaxID=1227497 RepID=L9X0Q2_9EURY|nr:polysaccharide deacetylase family protein [Natronococcus amylolyticus]ELY55339.1 polysaccharide deacetylase [Natronococcus amylolyticus DSM 10524]